MDSHSLRLHSYSKPYTECNNTVLVWCKGAMIMTMLRCLQFFIFYSLHYFYWFTHLFISRVAVGTVNTTLFVIVFK